MLLVSFCILAQAKALRSIFVLTGSHPGAWGFWSLGQVQGSVWKLPRGRANCPHLPTSPPPPTLPQAFLSLCHWKGTQSGSGFYFHFKNARCSVNSGTKRQLLEWTFTLQSSAATEFHFSFLDFDAHTVILPALTLSRVSFVRAFLRCSPSKMYISLPCPWGGVCSFVVGIVSLLTTPLPPAKKPKVWMKFCGKG